MKATKLCILAVIAALTAFLCASCTHNNGDIGKVFGLWKLTSIEAVDTEKPQYEGTMFWAFQSSTVMVTLVTESHNETVSYGNFRIADETLFLDFADENRPVLIPGTGRQSQWQLLRLDRKRMTLRLEADNEGYTVWNFRKW